MVVENILQQVLTFKTLTARLVVEILLATVVRNVSTVLLYLSPWVDLVPPDLPEGMIVQALKRRKVDDAFGLGLDEPSRILHHFGLL